MERRSIKCACWVALVPWAGLLPWGSSWTMIWFVLTTGVFVGWLSGSALPRPAKWFAGYAIAVSWWNVWKALTAKVTVQIGSSTLDPLSALKLLPILYLITAVLVLEWMQRWTREQTEQAVRWLAISFAVMVGYGWLQWFGLDQFNVTREPNIVLGGTLGNRSVFASVLAMVLPLWLTSRWGRWVILPAVGIVLLTGSATGFVASVVVMAWWLWQTGRWRQRSWQVGTACAAVGILTLSLWRFGLAGWMNPHGRLEAWAAFLDFWRTHQPITGSGIGTVYGLADQWPVGSVLRGWNHCHQDMGVQLLVELGVVGVALFGWMGVDAWRRVRRMNVESQVQWGGMLLASSVAALTMFPWHQPLTAFLTLIAYARVSAEGA